MSRQSLCALLLTGLVLLPGCWSYTPARPAARTAPAPLAKEAWPTRDESAVRPILDSTPREVFRFKLAEGVDRAALSEDDRRRLETPDCTVTYKGIHAASLLRIIETPPDASAITITVGGHTEKVSISDVFDGLITGFSPNAHMMSSRTLEHAKRYAQLREKLAPPTPNTPSPADAKDANLSITRTVPAPKLDLVDSSSLHLTDGLPIRIPPANPSKKPRGLILHYHAIAGNEYEPQVIAELNRRGWVSIDIKSEANIESPIPESWYPEIASLSSEIHDLYEKIYTPELNKAARGNRPLGRRVKANPLYPRLLQAQERHRKLSTGGYQVHSDDDLPAIAQSIAREVDDGLAGAAYAAQAILEYVKAERPDLQNIPIIMMGFSAGALATPTAAARVHDQLSAVVLVGGGCDLFRVSQESSFTNGGLNILNGEDKAPKSTIEKLDKLYLESSRLDPYHTAPLIADLPILQLHASTDTWVPFQTGELLYERLNHPTRLTMRGGHEYLFYFLPNKARWIADWVESTVNKGERRSASPDLFPIAARPSRPTGGARSPRRRNARRNRNPTSSPPPPPLSAA